MLVFLAGQFSIFTFVPWSSSQTLHLHMQQCGTMLENWSTVCLPHPITSSTCFYWEGSHSSSTSLARTVVIRGKPEGNKNKNRCGWSVFSKLDSYHREAGPQSASAYKETVRAPETSMEPALLRAPRCLDGTQTRARQTKLHALTVASPTQLEITCEETAPSCVGQHFSLLGKAEAWRQRGLSLIMSTQPVHSSTSPSFQRNTFIRKEVLSPKLPPGDEGAHFTADCGP